MQQQEASDLYLTVGLPPAYRIHGEIVRSDAPALHAADCEALARSAMNERQWQRFADEYEMNLALAYDDVGRFRANIFRQRSQIGMVVRKINTAIPTIDELGLPAIFKEISMQARGLVLMTGATGCGKSTSLAAMIDWRNSHQAGHIITIEDPIEFIHNHKQSVITQREVGSDTFEYHTALKNTLRQAPDVILIGEIRDRTTMAHAIEFAETGHLCLATLHANSANQALERVINFFPEEMHPQVCLNLSLNLKAILSQRLVRSHQERRLPATEILVNTPRIADLIGKWEIEEIKTAMRDGAQYGMQTFDQCLFKLWQSGQISETEALRHADAINDLRLQIKMAAIGHQQSPDDALDQLSPNLTTSDWRPPQH